MKNLLIVFIYTFLFLSVSAEDLNWLTFEDAAKIAEAENKIILVDFYTDWCGWCKKMDRNTYSNPEIIDSLNKNFVAVKINPESKGTVQFDNGELSYRALARQIGVRGYPATAFFSSDSKLIDVISGYQDPSDMKILLNYMDQSYFEKLTFRDYHLFKMLEKFEESNESNPEVAFLLGYFHYKFFDNSKLANNFFMQALDSNMKAMEVYAGLHLTTASVDESNNWLAKANELGYENESDLEKAVVLHAKRIVKQIQN